MKKNLVRAVFLVGVTCTFQACSDPYHRSPVEQVVNVPGDLWQKIARTHAP